MAEPGSPVKIRIQRWSTPEEATPLVAALNPPPASARRGSPETLAAPEAQDARPVAARAGAVVAARRRRR